MGIGLSVCRTIIEAHGGRLWMEPNPAGGSMFQFTVPTDFLRSAWRAAVKTL